MILDFSTKKLSAAFLTASLVIMPFTTAWAAQNKEKRWYEVEVIVFSNTDKQLQTTEKWPENPGTPNISNVLELFSEDELLFNDVEALPMYYVEPLELSENSLSPLAKKIAASNSYSLLTHRTWRQTVSRKKATPPVYLDDNLSTTLYQPLADPQALEEDGEEMSAEQLLLEALLAEEANMTPRTANTPFSMHQFDPIVPFDENEIIPASVTVDLSPMGPPNHALFGTLQFFKNRYLHIGIDFSYRAPPYEPEVKEMSLAQVFPMVLGNSEDLLIDETQLIKSVETLPFTNSEKPPYVGFRLKESKRIRLKEVHYFDHPLYGIIVRVSGYEPPEPEVENTGETAP